MSFQSTLTNAFSTKHLVNLVTAPFNDMGTLKSKVQPTNTFFATVNQMFGGFSQLPTTAEL